MDKTQLIMKGLFVINFGVQLVDVSTRYVPLILRAWYIYELSKDNLLHNLRLLRDASEKKIARSMYPLLRRFTARYPNSSRPEVARSS